MANKKLTKEDLEERARSAVETIFICLDVKAAVEKHMRAKGQIRRREKIADFMKECEVTIDEMSGSSDSFGEDIEAAAKVLVEEIIEEMMTYSKKEFPRARRY